MLPRLLRTARPSASALQWQWLWRHSSSNLLPPDRDLATQARPSSQRPRFFPCAFFLASLSLGLASLEAAHADSNQVWHLPFPFLSFPSCQLQPQPSIH